MSTRVCVCVFSLFLILFVVQTCNFGVCEFVHLNQIQNEVYFVFLVDSSNAHSMKWWSKYAHIFSLNTSYQQPRALWFSILHCCELNEVCSSDMYSQQNRKAIPFFITSKIVLWTYVHFIFYFYLTTLRALFHSLFFAILNFKREYIERDTKNITMKTKSWKSKIREKERERKIVFYGFAYKTI